MTLDIDEIIQKVQNKQKVIKIGALGNFKMFRQFLNAFDKSPSDGDIVNIKTIQYKHKNKIFIVQFVFQDSDVILEQFREEINQNMNCIIIFVENYLKIEKLEKYFEYGKQACKFLVHDFDTKQMDKKKNDVNHHKINWEEKSNVKNLLSKICDFN